VVFVRGPLLKTFVPFVSEIGVRKVTHNPRRSVSLKDIKQKHFNGEAIVNPNQEHFSKWPQNVRPEKGNEAEDALRSPPGQLHFFA